MNDIKLHYAGTDINHTITADDVADFVSERFAKPLDRRHIKSQLSDGIRLLDYAFDIGKRIGFAELFGNNPEFKAHLLNKMKGTPNGKPKNG